MRRLLSIINSSVNAQSKAVSNPDALLQGHASALERRRQRIIKAAKPVVLKYGYRGVTMNDLAQAAGISRAALYLVFPNKEDFFCEAVRELAREASEEANRGLKSTNSPIEKLKVVCEAWMVRPFDWLQSPEAKQIYESSHAFSEVAVHESMMLFEQDLATVIELFPKGTLPQNISHAHAAHLIAGAISGIRRTCNRSDELRKEIRALIGLVFRA